MKQPSLFRLWRENIRDALQLKSLWTTTPTWQILEPSYTSQSFENNVTYGYRRNELIFTAISFKADSTASAELKATRRSRTGGTDLPITHKLQRLLDRPSRDRTGFDFRSMTLIMLDLSGVCYWQKLRNPLKEVVELKPLRPDRMKPKKGSDGKVYEYGVGEEKQTIKREDLIIFRVYDPIDMYGGVAPVSVAGKSGDVDNATTDYLKLFFEHGGVPPGILSSKQKLVPADVTRLRAAWRERYGGYRNWLEPAVLDSDATYERLGFTFEEMGFDAIDARTESRICMVLRVPPILIHSRYGIEHATYSNYGQARISFWQDTLTPNFKRIKETLQRELVDPDFGIEYGLRWDYSDVPAIQEYLAQSRSWALDAWNGSAITRNEFYDLCGLETGRDDGDVYKLELERHIHESSGNEQDKTRLQTTHVQKALDRYEKRYERLVWAYFRKQREALEEDESNQWRESFWDEQLLFLSMSLMALHKQAAAEYVEEVIDDVDDDEDIPIEDIDTSLEQWAQQRATEIAAVIIATTRLWLDNVWEFDKIFSKDRAHLIAITETTEAQFKAVETVAEVMNVSKVQWKTEPGACSQCLDIEKDSPFERTAIPARPHPGCRCRISLHKD